MKFYADTGIVHDISPSIAVMGIPIEFSIRGSYLPSAASYKVEVHCNSTTAIISQFSNETIVFSCVFSSMGIGNIYLSWMSKRISKNMQLIVLGV